MYRYLTLDLTTENTIIVTYIFGCSCAHLAYVQLIDLINFSDITRNTKSPLGH